MIFLCFMIHESLHAQEVKKKKTDPLKYDWGNIGLGFPMKQLRSDVFSQGYGLDYSRAVGPVFLQGGVSGNIHYYIPSLFEIHFAPGYAIGYHKPVMVAMSIGPGYMSGDAENGETFHSLGANGTFQLLIKPSGDIGLGVEVYFNYPFLNDVTKAPASNGIRVVLTISAN